MVWAEALAVELEEVWARGYDIRYQRERDESSEQEMKGEREGGKKMHMLKKLVQLQTSTLDRYMSLITAKTHRRGRWRRGLECSIQEI